MASLLLSTGKYLHTAYAVSNIAEEFTNDDWSLSSQEGFGYIGQYIDDSAVDSSDPTDYVWTEFLDEDVDDLDDEGDMPMADFQSQIDALQDQIEVLQGDAENLQSSIEVNASNVADSAQLASEAADIANATGQFFWHDANGAHVSTEENNPEGERNSIWNSLGMLFRKGATNLLAVLAGGASGTDPKGIAVYDGEGNNAENVVASFTDSGSVIGKQGDAQTLIGNETISMLNADNVETFNVSSSGQTLSQPVTEYIFEYLDRNNSITCQLFQNVLPSSGTSFDVISYVGNKLQYIIHTFVFGTSATATENVSYSGQTLTLSYNYDGNTSLTISYTATGVTAPAIIIEKTLFTIVADAPSFTLGSRVDGEQAGAFSFTAGNSLVAANDNQVVFGAYNDYTTYASPEDVFVIGDGDIQARRNLLRIKKAANNSLGLLEFMGDVYIDGKISYATNLWGSQSADYVMSGRFGNLRILTGNETVNVSSSNTNTDVAVSYGVTFKYNPNVQLTMLNIGGSYYQKVSCASPSTTGFTIRVRAGNAPGNVNVNWVAIGELA